jgi:outer membrane receptor protein involved in Fe transport
MHRKIFYFLMILALSSSLLLAQKGKIKGKVTDLQTGDVLIGATVAIVGTPYGAQTGADGEYLIQNLDPGDYNVKVSYIGYKTMTWTKIRVNSDLNTYMDFKLPSDDIQVNTVEVVAERKLIQKSEAASSTIKTADDIKSLPTRSITTVINLSAGVASVSGVGTSIRGGRTGQTAYYLEGVQNTNPVSMGQNVGVGFDAVEEVSVQTGGLSAEYGNANSGVIRQTLKSGSSQLKASIEYITSNPTFMSLKDQIAGKKALGQFPLADYETSAVLSGPLFSNNIRFFTNLDYASSRGGSQYPEKNYDFGKVWSESANPASRDTIDLSWHGGALAKYMSQSLTSTTTLNFDIGSFRIRLTGILGYNWSNTTAESNYNYGDGFYSKYDDRGNNYYNWSQAYTARFTHILSSSMFYEINVAYNYNHRVNRDEYLGEQWQLYGDSAANARAGADWTKTHKDTLGGFVGPYGISSYGGVRARQLWGNWWYGKDAITTYFYKAGGWGLAISGTLNLNIGKQHSIRLGGEYRTYSSTQWVPGYTFSIDYAQSLANLIRQNPTTSVDELKAQLMRTNYKGGNGYDVYGNEVDDDWDGAFTPILASAFITDAIEYEDLIINVGLRYDYINPNSMKLVDPANPQLGVDRSTSPWTINPAGWEKVTPSSTVSPRINVVFPVSEKTKFRATYGNYVQMPNLSQMYSRPINFIRDLSSGYFQTYSALNMRPTRTTSYEVGLEQEVTDFLAIQLTGYYRDIKDELAIYRQEVSKDCPWQSYITYQNKDFATTKGIELNLNMRRYQRLLLNGSFSYSDARGTGSNPNSNLGIIGSPIEGQTFTPQYIAPLGYNTPVKASLNIDYRFGLDEGGPVFSGLGISLLVNYQNGHPYTRGTGTSAQLGNSSWGSSGYTGDTRSRMAVEPLNSSYTPNITTADMRIDKQFRIWDKLLGTIYLRINNVFNIRNVYNVYVKSGSAYDDGYLSDATESANNRALYGETWYQWQQFKLQYQNGFIGSPRTFVLGLRLDY